MFYIISEEIPGDWNDRWCDMMKEEMDDPEMEGMKEWWMKLPEEKKKALIKAKFDFKMKKLQLKMDYMKEIQKIFS